MGIGALQRFVFERRAVCFMVMVISFMTFGALTLNLAVLLKTNVGLVAEHGWIVLADGAAQQFVEIMFSGCIAMAAYLLFKACEYSLVHALLHKKSDEEDA
jgi:hypothetical protein